MMQTTGKRLLLLTVGWMCMVSLAGCNFNLTQQNATPSVEVIETLLTPSPSPTVLPPTLTPSATATPVPLATATATFTPQPPTETPLPSETPGPYVHVVDASDTLLYIVQLYGYEDLTIGSGGIVDQVVQLNGMFSADLLPAPGATLMIPRQTATPTPSNEQTAVANVATEAASRPNVQFAENTSFYQYEVVKGDTIVTIASKNDLTLEQISVANPDLDFSSCIFEIPSGGPDCNVSLQIGQKIQLPAPTPTPTPSPTPSGNETATATATYVPVQLVFPPDNAQAQAGVFSLQWVGVGVLSADEYYLVQVTDTTSGAAVVELTKNTSFTLAESLIPTDGQAHTFNWTVRVVKPNADGQYYTIGGESQVRVFVWQSR